MKALYWRSNYVSTPQLVVVAALAVMGLLGIESNTITEQDPLYQPKIRAARLAKQSFQTIYLRRIRLQIPLDTEADPAGSGLIGPQHSPIVSNSGHLTAKRTSANPNFAAVFVEMLTEAGVAEGDVVAVNATGSFPAMNVCVYAALEALGLQAIVISSAAASEYGASHPDLTWLDMEKLLYDRDLISFRSEAFTMGGIMDSAQGHTEEGREMLRAAIARNERPLMTPNDFEDAVSMRLAVYDDVAAGRPIRAFINIGGGTASVGTYDDKEEFRPGLNTRIPQGLTRNSVMRSFLEREVPVIHVSQVRSLARRYGLPDYGLLDDEEELPTAVPQPGEGGVFTDTVVNRLAILLVLVALLGAMFAATRFDIVASFSSGKGESKGPEQMV